jgi:hypothetical protein
MRSVLDVNPDSVTDYSIVMLQGVQPLSMDAAVPSFKDTLIFFKQRC